MSLQRRTDRPGSLSRGGGDRRRSLFDPPVVPPLRQDRRLAGITGCFFLPGGPWPPPGLVGGAAGFSGGQGADSPQLGKRGLVGFLFGMGFLLVLDTLIPHLHFTEEKPEGVPSQLKKTTMLVLAVTLHNIPEGMAVGVTFAGVMTENSVISLAGALALSIGIAIQNFPEGAIISMPLQSHGLSKGKAFLYGAMSGIVEPIAAVITIFLTGIAVPLLPYLLSFAAGAMIYVVVEELIPESQAGEHSNIGTIGVAAGFVLMMILDVALG